MAAGYRNIKLLAGLAFAVIILAPTTQSFATADRVLVLSSTVSGGEQSIEAEHAAALGFSVDVVDPQVWSSLEAQDFAGYRAIVLGAPRCHDLAAASAA